MKEKTIVQVSDTTMLKEDIKTGRYILSFKIIYVFLL
ncbi:MAG: hypothetical protein JWR18_1093 [Segetibacter sp.]|nr:hypothetical protein [Segetibacter sp.]